MTEQKLHLSDETLVQKEINAKIVELEGAREGVCLVELELQALALKKAEAYRKRFNSEADSALAHAIEAQKKSGGEPAQGKIFIPPKGKLL